MSKALDRARDLGYGTDPLNRAEYTANEVRNAFIEGYHQAEKDNELTWEDIKKIYHLVNEVSDDLGVRAIYVNIYQEVLKRFKNYKERKQQ